MIKGIVNTFYKVAEQHKLIRSFRYDQLSKSQGNGEENYPQLFLEDSIFIDNGTTTNGYMTAMLNFDITMIPQAFENYNVRQLTEEECQNVAMHIALNVIAKIRDIHNHYDEYSSEYMDMIVQNYSFVTLRHWFDNDCSGVRCTLRVSVPNMINYCDLEEHFDEDKVFDMGSLLSDINTDDAVSCVNFDFKLPTITL